MSRRRRLVAMFTASAAVLALGFVVAVAAGSLPGGGGDEPLFDFDFRPNLDLSPVLAWIILVLAVLGAVLFALGLHRSPTREDGRRRSILGTLIGVIIFVVIARWLRPAAEALLNEGSAVADSATDALGDDRVGTTGGWLFSILLAAILAAALTRIGLSIKTVPSPFQPDEAPMAPGTRLPTGVTPVPLLLGGDPRSRVLAAYEDFENRLAAVGRRRHDSETTASHARRAGRELNLDVAEVRNLVGHHARARFGRVSPTESDATAAERAASRLRSGMSE